MTARTVSVHMTRHRHLIHAATVATLLLPFDGVAVGQTRPTPGPPLALVGGTIYVSPTDAPIQDGVVLIRDGKIDAVGWRAAVQIPQGFQTLDCSGLTITAGFWNSHVHFMERQWAGELPKGSRPISSS